MPTVAIQETFQLVFNDKTYPETQQHTINASRRQNTEDKLKSQCLPSIEKEELATAILFSMHEVSLKSVSR